MQLGWANELTRPAHRAAHSGHHPPRDPLRLRGARLLARRHGWRRDGGQRDAVGRRTAAGLPAAAQRAARVQAARGRAARARPRAQRPHRAGGAARLEAGTRYCYRFMGRRGRRSDVGTFRTAPRRRARTRRSSSPGPATPTSCPRWASAGRSGTPATCSAACVPSATTSTSTSATRSTRTARSRRLRQPVPGGPHGGQKWAKYKPNLGKRQLRSCAARRASTRTGTTTSSSTTSRPARTPSRTSSPASPRT